MNGLCVTENGGLELRRVPLPTEAVSGHLLIRVIASGINGGDKAFLSRAMVPGVIAMSRYGIWGVSLAGEVVAVGAGVPERYKGAYVAGYRSLVASEHTVGTWSEYALLPYLSCVILPAGVEADDYAGSLVNIITPYAFLQQVREEGHRGIISTAGSSATGLAMLGLSLAYGVPLVSIVRSAEAKARLVALGATHVLVQTDDDFRKQLGRLAGELSATAVFDGVGGAGLNPILDVLPVDSTVYAYGYLGGPIPLSFHTSVLQRGLTITRFSNFRSGTVQDPRRLEKALLDIGEIIHGPYFRTKLGKQFSLGEISSAMAYVGPDGKKAILRF